VRFYALPTIRALGGGPLYIGLRFDTRQRLVPSLYAPLVPLLLRATDYVTDVRPWPSRRADAPEDFVDLDLFRRNLVRGRNIADNHLLAFGLDVAHRDRRWLTISDPRNVAPVVFHRSQRSRGPGFPWAQIYAKYANMAVFVGLPHEHFLCCREVGPVPFVRTADFYELARVIAGCRLYVGNQSAPLAVAEGLKVPLIAEHPLGDAACCRMTRSGALFNVTNETPLPDIG
jgi:hypothetical protein